MSDANPLSDELADQGVSIKLLRELESDPQMLHELYGWVIEPDETAEPATKDSTE